ncbi:hypothetical protein GQ53DRAFT_847927 [Thozetella sp. PMI_491]|nr:hypothetical protein GQ53DRAFT_847927 [Thozetella sp. PMI_491]
MTRSLARYAAVLGLPLALAAPTASSAPLSGCTNLKLTDNWLVGDCQGSSGSVTSAVFLGSWLGNKEGALQWGYHGNFEFSCTDCSLEGTTLKCTCPKSTNPPLAATIDLSEHIASYDGHLLSDVNGTPAAPQDGSVPVPAKLQYSVSLGTAAGVCSGTNLSSYGPETCFSLEFEGNQFLQFGAVGFTSENQGWSLTTFASTDCSGDALGSLAPTDGAQCKKLAGLAQSVRIVPLFNADW